MRELNIGSKRFTKIIVTDEPGHGGACHEYQIVTTESGELVGTAVFQNGPIKESGVNGCHQEDLLAIVIDRLECFQSGPFKCLENEEALDHIRNALQWLNERTSDRQALGVEGTNQHRKKENTMKQEQIAKVCHEVNKAYCEALGDNSQLPWEDAPEWARSSARMGVDLHTMGDFGPEASHISWMKQKVDEGWVFGAVKDPELKTHPCIVPFADLPVDQQAKDFIFRAVVHALKDL